MRILSPQPACYIMICLYLLGALLPAGCDRSAVPKSPQADREQKAADERGEHADHDGAVHALPGNYEQGVSELKEHYAEIKKAFALPDVKEAVEQAHKPLHNVGEILEVLPELAKRANLSPEDLQIVKKSVEAMFEGYGNIDSAVHEGKQPDYQGVATEIDDAMAAMEAVHVPQGQEDAAKH